MKKIIKWLVVSIITLSVIFALSSEKVTNPFKGLSATVQAAENTPAASIVLRKYTQSRRVNYTFSFPDSEDRPILPKYANTDISWTQDKNDKVISSVNVDAFMPNLCEPPLHYEYTYDDLKSPKGRIVDSCIKSSTTTEAAPPITLGQRIGGITYHQYVFKDNNPLGEIDRDTKTTVNEDSRIFMKHNGVTNGNNIWVYNIRVSADEIFVKDYANGQPNFFSKTVPCNKIGLAAYGKSSDCLYRVITAATDSAPYEVDVTPSVGVPYYQYSVDIVDGPRKYFSLERPIINGQSDNKTGSIFMESNLAQVGSYNNIIKIWGKVGSAVHLNGTGFSNSNNWVRISNGSSSYTISGVLSTDGKKIIFTLPDRDVLTDGVYNLSVAGYDTEWSNPAQLTIGSAPAPLGTIVVTPRINGRALTSTEANGCVSSLISPNGSGNTAGCVRSFNDQAAGKYSVVWYGGYPTGADTAKKPVVTPAQTLGTSNITFYIDFASKPTTNYIINIRARINGRVLAANENGTCAASLVTPNNTRNTAGCIRTLENQPIGTYPSVIWNSGYPVGADTTKKPTISPSYPQSLGDRPAGVNPITFYIDFAAKPSDTSSNSYSFEPVPSVGFMASVIDSIGGFFSKLYGFGETK